jgi:Lar family restriction alleviation protein
MPNPPTRDRAALLPCPFCGPGQSQVDLVQQDIGGRWQVFCGRCGSSSGVHPRDKTQAPAIAAWNTRPTAPGDGLAGVVVTEDERNTLLIALQEHRDASMRYATNFREDEPQFTEFRDAARRCSALIDRLLGQLE